KDSPTQRFHALYDKVYRKDVLAHAYGRRIDQQIQRQTAAPANKATSGAPSNKNPANTRKDDIHQ
ncbi:MAG: hypothetical protein ACP5I8_15010, partial [Phycisphaerae bacterium]